MPRLLHPRPMATFDLGRRARVHEQLNDKTIDWDPTWADRRDRAPGVVEWDGLLLDGWEPADKHRRGRPRRLIAQR